MCSMYCSTASAVHHFENMELEDLKGSSSFLSQTVLLMHVKVGVTSDSLPEMGQTLVRSIEKCSMRGLSEAAGCICTGH